MFPCHDHLPWSRACLGNCVSLLCSLPEYIAPRMDLFEAVLAPRMDLFQAALAPRVDLFQVSLLLSIPEYANSRGAKTKTPDVFGRSGHRERAESFRWVDGCRRRAACRSWSRGNISCSDEENACYQPPFVLSLSSCMCVSVPSLSW